MTQRDAGNEGPVPARIREAIARQHLVFEDTFPGALGVRIVEAAPGHAVGTMEVGPAQRHPGGYAHAGALAGFGDTVAAWATLAALREDETFTTIEFKANFLAGVTEGRLRAEASAVHRGKRTIVLEVKVTADDGGNKKMVCLMIVTQAVLGVGGAPGGESAPEG